MTVLRFYFDYISPYAYVGWRLARELAEERGVELVPEPVLFAALLNAHGQKGPAEIPAKRGYVFKDAFRKAHAAGLGPLVPPPNHPFNPLLALRATLAVPVSDRGRAVTSLYAATWAGGGGIETTERVVRALESAGLDGADLVHKANGPEVKATLRANSNAAIGAGVFGVPTLAIGAELFFGVDGFAFVRSYLDGRDPVPADLLATWSSLSASASRT
jgi:2-hydroxychromene-2-carboxylate isomerase